MRDILLIDLIFFVHRKTYYTWKVKATVVYKWRKDWRSRRQGTHPWHIKSPPWEPRGHIGVRVHKEHIKVRVNEAILDF